MVPAFFKVSLRRFLWLMLAYTLFRVLFLLWNQTTFAANSWREIAWAFVLGLRFDASAILLSNAVMFALWMLPSRWLARSWARALDLALLGLFNLWAVAISFADAEYVNFTGKRTSYDVLFIRGDVKQQSTSLLATYWYLAVAVLVFLFLVLWFMPRFSREAPREFWFSGLLWRVATVGVIVLGMRGGTQFKPITPMNAYGSGKNELGLLALNTPFNLIKTRGGSDAEHPQYFTDTREAVAIVRAMTEPSRPPLGVAKGWNVVVLIVESLGSEYTSVANNYKGYTPFVDQLARKSFYFKDNFANARRSIDGVPAVLCGLPAIMDEATLTSEFATDRMDCLPKLLGQQGYSTYFLHGAHNGSMHFDAFSGMAGFSHFVGLNEYPKDHPEDLDEAWGVLDEPMLQYAVRTIDEAPKPTFLSVFTLSSHSPYYIPPKYRGKFPKGPLEIDESIGYADYALAQFFKAAESKPWFQHTIFVITGDHTQKWQPDHPEYRTFIGSFRVPLIIYAPGLTAAQVGYQPKRITQHIDVLPSVLDLLGIERRERFLLGQSVFDQGLPGRAYNYTLSGYWYMDPNVVVDLGRGQVPLRVYTHTDTVDRVERSADDPRFQPALRNLKAIVQYMIDGLVHNNLYTWDARR